MAETVISVRGVGRHFGTMVALDAVDLEVFEGEILGLIGPNGGGKSTLLYMMAGLIAPSSGSIHVRGVPAMEVAVRHRGTVGLITADHGLYPLLTGQENLTFFGGLFGLSRGEVAARARDLVEELGLTESLSARVSTYSSGMRQKLSLVRATLLEPRVLLLDEPTSNLDPVSADTIYRAIRSRADDGLAVVLVTHDLHSAEHVCDRVAVLSQTVRELVTAPSERSPPPPSRLLTLYRQHAE